MTRPRIAILAQDLIWADRLARAVEAAGGEPTRAKTAPELDRALACADHAIVDLTAQAYDPIAVAIHKMAIGGFRHIPIIENGRPTGVVTARDVFRHLAETLD
jgi:hypothetical protein